MVDLENKIKDLLSGASGKLAQLVASSSFEFWQRKDFRLYVDFSNISQTEQDRMFNELEVTVLGLFTLNLENTLETVREEEKKIVIKALKNELVPAFLQMFKDLGVENKFVKQWEMLIDMRFEEYRKDFKIGLKESSKWEEFKSDEQDLKVAWARIETMTIDCLTHIRRGKVEKDDPLWKLLRKWLITLDAQITPIAKLGREEKN